MPGARCTRSLACKIKQAYERSHHGHTGNHPAFPAQWFYGLLRALPGDQACLTPSPALLIADLTPASGRQNHTTSPSASALLVKHAARVHRIPPRVRDDREPPLCGTGPNRYSADLPPSSSEISEIQKLTAALCCRMAVMGATHFQMKTLKHVSTEMALHVRAYNMKRVMSILGVGGLMEATR